MTLRLYTVTVVLVACNICLTAKKNDMTQRLLGQGIAPNGGTTHHLCLAATGIVHHPSFLAYPIPSSLARFQSLVNTLRNSACTTVLNLSTSR